MNTSNRNSEMTVLTDYKLKTENFNRGLYK